MYRFESETDGKPLKPRDRSMSNKTMPELAKNSFHKRPHTQVEVEDSTC